MKAKLAIVAAFVVFTPLADCGVYSLAVEPGIVSSEIKLARAAASRNDLKNSRLHLDAAGKLSPGNAMVFVRLGVLDLPRKGRRTP